ncbi:basic membrane protein A [Proteiniborus ethanoligenes]|uniref:Basic membrane protein A n=1 Tax=Proteiniborus ethanoligenes TaxID=415015 RepID=A0A1H3LLT1_9FIRM|nr:BMP family ABC transporter substrate-binding protein [Proteiniborus ethanoligenes]SDY65392.1 basic membrane protein A [Proteiniborus ethanoligenes]
MKKFLSLLLVLIMLFTLVACGKDNNQVNSNENIANNENVSGTDEGEKVKVGLLTGVAGLGDKSFNDLAYDGAKQAEKELNIELKVVEPIDLASTEGLLRDLANAGNDMVIGVGFDMAEPMNIVSQEFPDTKFAIVDAVVEQPNVQSLTFKEHEGSFLIGALTALMTETNKVGCIPAMDIPFLNRFTNAYEQGVKYINKDIEVIVQPIGSDFSAFNDPGKAKNIAASMYSQGIDIIYPVAGGSGTGLFEAAKDANKYALGINSDQDYMAEGLVLASMMKRVDVAVFESIQDVVDKSFVGELKLFGLENNGVGLSEMKYTKDIIGEEVINKLEEIKKGIIDGTIEVIDVTAQ